MRHSLWPQMDLQRDTTGLRSCGPRCLSLWPLCLLSDVRAGAVHHLCLPLSHSRPGLRCWTKRSRTVSSKWVQSRLCLLTRARRVTGRFGFVADASNLTSLGVKSQVRHQARGSRIIGLTSRWHGTGIQSAKHEQSLSLPIPIPEARLRLRSNTRDPPPAHYYIADLFTDPR